MGRYAEDVHFSGILGLEIACPYGRKDMSPRSGVNPIAESSVQIGRRDCFARAPSNIRTVSGLRRRGSRIVGPRDKADRAPGAEFVEAGFEGALMEP